MAESGEEPGLEPPDYCRKIRSHHGGGGGVRLRQELYAVLLSVWLTFSCWISPLLSLEISPSVIPLGTTRGLFLHSWLKKGEGVGGGGGYPPPTHLD